jgi:hypothetical protein
MGGWVDRLMSIETTEATRHFAVFSVSVGVFLAWKSRQSARTAARKANDQESEPAR